MTIRLAFFISLVCCSTFAGPLVTTNLLLNPGGEDNNLVNWVVGGDSSPRLDNGTFDPGLKPHSGTNQFLGGRGAVGTLTQIVSLVGKPGVTTTTIDAGGLLAYVSFWEQGLGQGTSPNDDGYVSIAFLGATSNNISGWASPEVDSPSVWTNYSSYVPIPAGTRFVQYTMNFIRHAGADLDAFMDDNLLAVTDFVSNPVLSITTSPTNVIVSWPAAYSSGFELQQNANLTVTNWTTVSASVQTVNGTNQVLLSTPPPREFFRLYHP